MAIQKQGGLQNTATAVAGENLLKYDVCYSDAGEMKKAKATTTETEAEAIAIALSNISSGSSGVFAFGNTNIRNSAWSWTPGAQLYLSETYGQLTETCPDETYGMYVKPLGVALSETLIHFSPQTGWVVGDYSPHAGSHSQGGSDEIDGDRVDIDWNPSNYTPATVTETTSVDHLSSHLKGIDDKLASEITQDVVGAMLSSNVETGVTLTYDDSNAKIDAYVTPYDVVGGRLDLVSATSIKWGFQNSNHIRLFNPTSEQWELVQATTEPTIANTALVPNTIYDVFAEYNSATAFDLVLSRWATGGDGANNSSTSYATPVMTANNAPGPVTVSATSILAGQYEYTAFNQADGTQDSTGSWISNATPSSGSPQSLMVDFGQPVCINKYILKERYASTQNYRAFPKTWTLEGSNSGAIGDAAGDVNGTSGWYLLDTVASSTEPGNNAWEAAYHTFINNKSFQKYRLRITDRYGSDSYVAINELKLVAASNSLAGGSSRVRAYESTVTYNIGDRVTYGSPTHYYCCIQAGTNKTPSSETAYWQDNGVAADVGSSDFYGLYRHNGVLVSDSSTTGKSRRWLGIIYTYNNSGTVNFKDDVNYRYVSNFYNTQKKHLASTNSTFSWTYASGAWRESYGGTTQIRGQMVVCQSTNITATVFTYAVSGAAALFVGLGTNSTSSASIQVTWPSSVSMSNSASKTFTITPGYNYITTIEFASGGQTATLYGGSGAHLLASTLLDN